MRHKYAVILYLPVLFCACATVPVNQYPDFMDWQEYRFQLSDSTLVFTAPSSGYSYPKSRSVNNVDIYDESIYHPIAQKILFSFMAWDWKLIENVEGRMGFGVDIVVYPVEELDDKRSIKKLIDQRNRNEFKRNVSSVNPNIPYTPVRFKHVLRFSENDSKWLVSDYPQGPPGGIQNPEAEEIFTYPLDDTHFLNIYFIYMDNTYQKNPDGNKHLRWYSEAEAVTDRILESVRIERTTPMPNIEYGATDIGVVSPSQIPYIDHLSERPPLSESKK